MIGISGCEYSGLNILLIYQSSLFFIADSLCCSHEGIGSWNDKLFQQTSGTIGHHGERADRRHAVVKKWNSPNSGTYLLSRALWHFIKNNCWARCVSLLPYMRWEHTHHSLPKQYKEWLVVLSKLSPNKTFSIIYYLESVAYAWCSKMLSGDRHSWSLIGFKKEGGKIVSMVHIMW